MARVGGMYWRGEMHAGFWLENLDERDFCMGGRIKLK
jgi:hypothetical protein